MCQCLNRALEARLIAGGVARCCDDMLHGSPITPPCTYYDYSTSPRPPVAMRGCPHTPSTYLLSPQVTHDLRRVFPPFYSRASGLSCPALYRPRPRYTSPGCPSGRTWWAWRAPRRHGRAGAASHNAPRADPPCGRAAPASQGRAVTHHAVWGTSPQFRGLPRTAGGSTRPRNCRMPPENFTSGTMRRDIAARRLGELGSQIPRAANRNRAPAQGRGRSSARTTRRRSCFGTAACPW